MRFISNKIIIVIQTIKLTLKIEGEIARVDFSLVAGISLDGDSDPMISNQTSRAFSKI